MDEPTRNPKHTNGADADTPRHHVGPSADERIHARYDIAVKYNLNTMETCALVRILKAEENESPSERAKTLEKAVWYLQREVARLRGER